jgi:hypothetical protein
MILLFIFACSGGYSSAEGRMEKGKEEIDWLERIETLYPAQLYITGLGMGKTKEDADNNAFRNVSKSIKLHVKSEEVSRERYRQSNTREEISDFQYNDNLKVESESILENARIEKHSYDSEKDLYYSLAVLRKSKYAEILSSRIMESREKSRQIAGSLEQESSPVIRLGLMFKLEEQSALQRSNYEILKVVSGDYRRYRPQPDELEVRKMIEKFLHEDFALSVEIQGELSRDIEMVLMEEFTENGYYIISDDRREPDIKVTGGISMRESRGSNRMVTVNWSLNLNFREVSSGSTIYSHTIRERQMQPTIEMARERIMYHISNEHAERIIEGFQEKMRGEAGAK